MMRIGASSVQFSTPVELHPRREEAFLFMRESLANDYKLLLLLLPMLLLLKPFYRDECD
jgi:hypothetical protein